MGDRVAVLAPLDRSDGSNPMQIGTPLDLYNEPDNVFVARFIGTPKMNLLEARVDEIRADDGSVMLLVGTTRFKIPDHYAVEDWSEPGSVILVGFRPEHLGDATDSRWQHTAKLSGTVEIVETLGSEIVVYMRCEGQLVSSKLTSLIKPPATGSVFEAQINLDYLHLFDPTTQKRLPYKS